MTTSWWLALLLPLSLASCEATTDGDPGGEGEGEMCGTVRCPAGYACVDGACLPDDGCGALTCDDGFVCSQGNCVPDGTDAGADGGQVEPDAGPDPEPDAGPDPEPDAGPDPEPDAGPDPPDPCDICDPNHHVETSNGEPCDCDERWRVVFGEDHGTSVSQVCRDGAWLAYNLDPSDPAACCAGIFAGCEQG